MLRILVATETYVRLYSSSLETISIINTTSNPLGICCLNNAPSAVFAGALGITAGSVVVQKVPPRQDSGSPAREGDGLGDERWDLPPPVPIMAHQSGIAAMCISDDGSFVATASEKGTVIRVYEMASGKQLKELRRGMKSAVITSLSFSPDGSMLLVSSNTGTVHLFDLTSG